MYVQIGSRWVNTNAVAHFQRIPSYRQGSFQVEVFLLGGGELTFIGPEADEFFSAVGVVPPEVVPVKYPRAPIDR